MDLRGVKDNLNKKVLYNGNPYTLTACVIRKDKKTSKFYYQAELQDTDCDFSLLYCRLEDIEEEHHESST